MQKKRIKERFPGQPFEIIEYTRMTKPFTIKCLKCGRIKTYSSTSNYLRPIRKGLCPCYNENNNFTKHFQNKEKAKKIIEEKGQTFITYGYKADTKKYTITVQCGKCGQLITKPLTEFCKCPDCYFCETKQKMNTAAFSSLLPKEYTLLSEYKGQQERVLIKHECGFIWTVIPHSFLQYRGCPKCNRKRSKGERRIGQFLDKKEIAYSIEYRFSWQSNPKRRYDFYLPELNMVIEYMGEQHYNEKSCKNFGLELKEQQKIDEEKKQEVIQNGLKYLAISYKDYKNIEEILSKIIGSTTILDASASKEQDST